MDLEEIISQVLEAIKKEAFEVIFSKRKNFKESDVEWKVIVQPYGDKKPKK